MKTFITQDDFSVLIGILEKADQVPSTDEFRDHVIYVNGRYGGAIVKSIESNEAEQLNNCSTAWISTVSLFKPNSIRFKENIFEDVCLIISDVIGTELTNMSMKTRLVTDLDVDSLDLIELAMKIEDKYCIDMSDVDTEKMYTIGDIVKYLNNHPMWNK